MMTSVSDFLSPDAAYVTRLPGHPDYDAFVDAPLVPAAPRAKREDDHDDPRIARAEWEREFGGEDRAEMGDWHFPVGWPA